MGAVLGLNARADEVAAPCPAGVERSLLNTDEQGLAVAGYDVVNYFTASAPLAGKPEHSSRHLGATYRFASAEHKALFDADPAKYAPAYGGYCGFAASIGRVSSVSPESWSIVDGQLILQNGKVAMFIWDRDVSGNHKKAHGHWPDLVKAKGRCVPVDPAGSVPAVTPVRGAH